MFTLGKKIDLGESKVAIKLLIRCSLLQIKLDGTRKNIRKNDKLGWQFSNFKHLHERN